MFLLKLLLSLKKKLIYKQKNIYIYIKKLKKKTDTVSLNDGEFNEKYWN